MNVKYFISSIFAALLLTACGVAKKTESEAFDTQISVDVVSFGEEDPVIGKTLSMLRVGDRLILMDVQIDSAFHIIDVSQPEARYIGMFGRKGQGPNDFGNITLISTIPGSDNSFGAYDPGRHKFTEVILNEGNNPVKYGYSLKIGESGWFICSLGPDAGYVNSSGYVDYYDLFEKYDKNGRLTGRYGDRQIPAAYAGYAPVHVTAAYQYDVIVSPDGCKIAAIGDGERAGFYRLEGDSLVMVSQFALADQDHTFENGEYLGVRGKTPYGFVSSAADNENVYIIYSDLSMNDDDTGSGNNFISGDEIRVYGWDGELRGVYHLDRRIRHLTAPDKDGVIYGISDNATDPELVTFRIK